jgi:hypothetical protein
MNKPIWASKTMWGFGVAAIIAVAQQLGVVADSNIIANLGEILSALFGAYGLRSALK